MARARNRAEDALDRFHPAVSSWFRARFGQPTPAQKMGWPVIASGQNALIVAPTGSGKTLAAFLAALDHLWRSPRTEKGVRILYVSPLKALNQDVERNLRVPLGEVSARAREIGANLPDLRVAVRSGDTPAAERARMLRRPPDILITTPESLHLMLTSRARDGLRGVSHVIVDEIHAVCGNKRGVFLAFLLERLEAINPQGFVRVGLSATQRPLEEVAHYLGGWRRTGPSAFERRPVAIVDAGRRRDLDLAVVWPAPTDQMPAPGEIWPLIEKKLSELVRAHRSTIVFTNYRGTVERLTSRLNEAIGPVRPLVDSDDGPDEMEVEDATDRGPSTGQVPPNAAPFRAHHGSLNLDERRATEEALKRGEALAVVATASLELGIDMGAVDLVCQVEAVGSVARGLQRVGRAGHVVRGVSRGRLVAKTPSDLLESAALCRAMLDGDIERSRVPRGCLDVLAQQVVACVAGGTWDVSELFDLARRAEPFHDLSAEAFEGVLKMVSGRFPTPGLRDLRARVGWDPIANRLAALPGSAREALIGGGTIPDTGNYPVYLGDGGPRLGELDEEFVYERRVGETFLLGSSAWRIDAIEPHRVLVSSAAGQLAMMPFWRGEARGRSEELGAAVGALARELGERLHDPNVLNWLEQTYRLEPSAARALRRHVAWQKRAAGAVPDDRTVLVEAFPDQSGELVVAVLTPWGGKLHQGLKLALLGRIRQRFGIAPACLHGDDGLLFRLPNIDEPPLDLLDGLTGELAESLVREELPDTALFGMRFRQNAARALLMPRPAPGKRSPLWLQRLRAKDLLQIARKFPDFPIVIETYRECLDDDLDLPRLRAFLDAVQSGAVRVVRRAGDAASPWAGSLLFAFTAAYIYEWDGPKRGARDRAPNAPEVDDDLLAPLLRGGASADWLDPQAIGRVDNRLRRRGRPPRTAEEMAEHLRRLGDLAPSELEGPMPALLDELRAACRARIIRLIGAVEPARWVLVEQLPRYRDAFPDALAGPDEEGNPRRDDVAGRPSEEATERARAEVVEGFLHTRALIGLSELTDRYPIGPAEATELLERWAERGGAVRVDGDGDGDDDTQTPRWAERENLAEIRRATIAARRREAQAVAPEVFADFLSRWQHVHPETRGEGEAFVETALRQLQGLALPARVWESDVLPARVAGYRANWLDGVLNQGTWLWRVEAAGAATISTGERAAMPSADGPRVAFQSRDRPGLAIVPPSSSDFSMSRDEALVLERLGALGASFAADLALALGIEPTRTRRALIGLMARGLATNDRFDPARFGAGPAALALDDAAGRRALARGGAAVGGRARARPPRSLGARPEGRWSRLDALDVDPDVRLAAWIEALLERYGVLSREVVALERSAPPWSALAPVLARAEWRGEVRRGYFVEGLSGAQYATAEAAAELARLAALRASTAPVLVLATIDPANLYGAGAPFDLELLDGGAARLPRQASSFLALRAGRPVLIIEFYGRRLTALPWAGPADIADALAHLPALATPSRRVLKVETFNGTPAAESAAAERLAELGFVRDYPAMAYYLGWAGAPRA